MKILFYVVRHAPVSRLRKINWNRRLVAASYRSDMRAAKKAGDNAAVESIKESEHYELVMLRDEEDDIRSQMMVALAKKYDIPLPPQYDANKQVTEDWLENGYCYYWALSDKGRAKLREEIRKERKGLHEERIRWLAWVAPLTGIIGAITGLVAVIAKVK